MRLDQAVLAGRTLGVLGLDDAHCPIERRPRGEDPEPAESVPLIGAFCRGRRFEGLLLSEVTRDGRDAVERMITMIVESKYHPQLHLLLLDGITLAGFNMVDLPAIHAGTGLPTVAVMRRRPDLTAFRHAMSHVSEPEERWRCVEAAGPIHELRGFVFQVAGAEPEIAALALKHLTDRGQIPEPLRLAHLIGSALGLGESRGRA